MGPEIASGAFLSTLRVESVPGACLKEEGLPTPARIVALRRQLTRPVPILTRLGALYGLFDLEQGSDGFNTGFAFPEVLMEMVAAARHERWDAVRSLYVCFLPLIVFEQQPGVAIRKEILRRRGLLASHRVRHPGAGVTPESDAQLTRLLEWIMASARIMYRRMQHRPVGGTSRGSRPPTSA